MYSVLGDAALPAPGFPIGRSTGQRLFSASPWLIAAVHVLLRLLVPRHPPCALTILTVSCSYARVRMSSASYPFWTLQAHQVWSAHKRPRVGTLGLVQFSRSTEATGRGSPAGVSEN